MPQLAGACIIFKFPHYAVIAQEFEFVQIATLFQFQFRIQQLTGWILAAMLGDDGFQRQNFPGAAQAANFVMIAPGYCWPG